MTQSCDVNAQDNSGNTALHVAQVKKHLGPVVSTLLLYADKCYELHTDLVTLSWSVYFKICET